MQEKRAVKFATDLMSKYGYGYTISTPVMVNQRPQRKRRKNISSHLNVNGVLESLGAFRICQERNASPYMGRNLPPQPIRI